MFVGVVCRVQVKSPQWWQLARDSSSSHDQFVQGLGLVQLGLYLPQLLRHPLVHVQQRSGFPSWLASFVPASVKASQRKLLRGPLLSLAACGQQQHLCAQLLQDQQRPLCQHLALCLHFHPAASPGLRCASCSLVLLAFLQVSTA